MLTSVHAHGGGSEETPQVGPRCTDGKDEHKKCVLDGASASTGSFSAGCAVGGAGVCRCSTSLWPLICTKNFNALADGLEWIAKEHGVERFITCGAENSDECKLNLQMLLDVI